ncbi:MAG: hypothetical protein WA857_22360 [Candidatus Acidiferrum sp.]
MISERIPSKLGYQPVVLMRVPSVMSENQIWGRRFQLVEVTLDLCPFERKVTISKVFGDDFLAFGPTQKKRCAAASLPFSFVAGAENNPDYIQLLILGKQTQNSPAAAYLNVI